MKISRLLGVVGATLFLLIISPAYATSVTYNYVGNAFDTFTGTGPWDTSSNVTATIELPSPLIPDMFHGEVVPLSWTLSDGNQVISDSTTNVTSTNFYFSTDSLGNISGWDIYAQVDSYTGAPVEGDTEYGIGTGNYPSDYYALDEATLSTYDGTSWLDVSANIENYPGTWSIASVPIPAAIWLFGSGLLGLVGIARRKKA